jgi:hypothetical protein
MEFGYLDGQCGLDIYQNTNTGILMWGYRGIKPKITAPSTTTYNICDTNIVQLSALPTGGVWGGAANVGGSFIPAYFYASGDYWITYSYLDPQGCYTNVDSLKITITATTPVPTMSKTLRNITVASEQTVCYDATQNITLAGNDSSFLVQEGGTVHLIAGQRIVMLPGTKAVSGSNLHGFISHNCLWCSAINGDQPQFISTMKNSDLKPKQVNNVDFEDFSLQIYPNPTKGDFTIDLLPKPEGVKIQVLVFSSLGEQVLQTTIGESAKVTLSIEDQPAGIYIVKVILKGRVAIVKIIKS